MMPSASSSHLQWIFGRWILISLCLGALLWATPGGLKVWEGRALFCGGNAALKSTANVTVKSIKGTGYGFDSVISSAPGVTAQRSQDVTRGLIILPETGVRPAAYASYAKSVAQLGFHVTIVQKATPGAVVQAMVERSELQIWCLAGHGTGGQVAAKLAVTLQPKVKGLVLMAAGPPPDVDLRSVNLFVSVIYGTEDTLTPPDGIESSFSRIPGDAVITKLAGISHYDFAESSFGGNLRALLYGASKSNSLLFSVIQSTITVQMLFALALAQWFPALEEPLSYGDNHYLTPGFNDSKPYPGHIRVRFDEVPIPGTSPQRVWWVFTPSEIKAGLVYYGGAAVPGQSYFPLAFEIAARGHLVVILQQSSRVASLSIADASTVIDSNLSTFSGVSKGRWAVAGHSAGGLTAASYVACFGDKVYGAVMHAGGWASNSTTSQVPVLQLYGSLDSVNGRGNNSYREMYLNLSNPNTTSFKAVQGANHGQVGAYGHQSGDQIATISLEAQHSIFAIETVNFLDALETKRYDPILFGPPLCQRAVT